MRGTFTRQYKSGGCRDQVDPRFRMRGCGTQTVINEDGRKVKITESKATAVVRRPRHFEDMIRRWNESPMRKFIRRIIGVFGGNK